MKRFVLAAALVAIATPSYAQLGGILSGAQKANDAKNKISDMTFSPEEERSIGDQVSTKLRARFGVVQDQAIHKYVTLVGESVASSLEPKDQPKMGWVFIVLDTDGVNAFAAPGGFIHVTRGALALAKNESELASILGHEVGHVAHRHTINALRNANIKSGAMDAAGSTRVGFIARIADLALGDIIDGKWSRTDEMDSDKVSAALVPKAGYASTLDDFLVRLTDRNKDMPTRNGLFASHPDTKARLDALKKLDSSTTTTVLMDARYKSNVKYELLPVTSIAVVADGAAGLTGGKDAKEEPKKEEPKKSGGIGLGALKKTAAPEKQTAQVQASGGSRGVGPDRDAKGGGNPAIVKVAVTAADVAAFKKGIA